MPRAEAGTVKAISNQIKSRGLNRLRWYCTPCQRSMRDENGFKMHCQSASHVAAVQALAGEGAGFRGAQDEISREFEAAFIALLRTAHGEKAVHVNRFYQEFIQDRHHTHLNATRWPSLTAFSKHLAGEGLCRVEEREGEGIFVAWIDDSPEAMRRRDAVRRRELQDKGDEEREQAMLREQIRRARQDAGEREEGAGKEREGGEEGEGEGRDGGLLRQEGEKIVLSFGAKLTAADATTPEQGSESTTEPAVASTDADEGHPSKEQGKEDSGAGGPIAAAAAASPAASAIASTTTTAAASAPEPPAASKPTAFKMAAKPKTGNVFKSAFAGKAIKKVMAAQPEKKISAAQRIMEEELERKRRREACGGGGSSSHNKRPRF